MDCFPRIPMAAGVVAAGLCATACPSLADPVIGVLTPNWVPKTIQVAGHGFPLPEIGLLGVDAAIGSRESQQARALMSAADRDKFDPVQRIQAAVVEELLSAGRVAKPLVVRRQAFGGNTSLRREDLPHDSGASLLLDIGVSALYLVEMKNEKGYRPGAVLSFVWLDAAGRPLGPRKGLVFNSDINRVDHTNGRISFMGRRYHEDIAPTAECEFQGPKEAESDAVRLWGCFDEGLDRLANLITASVPK